MLLVFVSMVRGGQSQCRVVICTGTLAFLRDKLLQTELVTKAQYADWVFKLEGQKLLDETPIPETTRDSPIEFVEVRVLF